MPRQVPFTEYEAALLLDAYLKTLSGEKERMESVRDCSLQLRQMALNAGSEIDDIYRNVNGISFQMASMESAYQGHTIMKPATRLFTEIVFLYRNVNIESNGSEIIFTVNIGSNTKSDIYFMSALKTAMRKTAYCIGCGVCEANCPNGFISMNSGSVHVDEMPFLYFEINFVYDK